MKQEGGGDLRARVHRVKSRALEALLLVAANSFIDAWYYYCCILWNNFLGNRVSEQEPKTVCVETSTSMVAESGVTCPRRCDRAALENIQKIHNDTVEREQSQRMYRLSRPVRYVELQTRGGSGLCLVLKASR